MPELEPLPDVSALARRLLAAGGEDVYRTILLAVDAAVLAEAATALGGNQVKMARALGLSRTTVRAKIRSARMAIDGRRKAAGQSAA